VIKNSNLVERITGNPRRRTTTMEAAPPQECLQSPVQSQQPFNQKVLLLFSRVVSSMLGKANERERI
jgi:hypothetical protein